MAEQLEFDPDSNVGNGTLGKVLRLWRAASARNFELPYALEVRDAQGQMIYALEVILNTEGKAIKADEYSASGGFDLDLPLIMTLKDAAGNSVADTVTARDFARSIQ
jgi:hypothetical protein